MGGLSEGRTQCKRQPIGRRFSLAREGIPAKVQTWTTVLYDDEALYVGVRMAEPNPAGLVRKLTQYDGPLWWDDSVEVYVETGCTHLEYFKFMSNPLGTRADWRCKQTPMGFEFFDFGTGAAWTVAAHIGADFWSLEFRFPWDDFETAPPQPGAVWTFEIVRFRYADGFDKREYSSWNVGAFHSAPQRFGNIVFRGATREMETLLADRIAPVAGGAVKLYGTRGEIRYTDYETLKREKAVLARNRIAELTRRVEAKTRQGMLDKLGEHGKRRAELEAAGADAITAEGLDKLAAAIGVTEWTVRYHELNAAIADPTSAPGRK